MQDVEIGQIVYWYPDGDTQAEPHPAIVTAVGSFALTLNIVGRDLRNFIVRDSVHHIDDPLCRKEEFRESGGWDHTPFTKSVKRLMEQLV